MEETYYAHYMIFAMTCYILYTVLEEQSREQNFNQYVVSYGQIKEQCWFIQFFYHYLKSLKFNWRKVQMFSFKGFLTLTSV